MDSVERLRGGGRERERDNVSGEGGGNYSSRCDDRACQRVLSMSRLCIPRLHKSHALREQLHLASPRDNSVSVTE